MITLQNSGAYKLIETIRDTRVLFLNGQSFAWISAEGIGEILVTAHGRLTTDYVLSAGLYRLYKVSDELTLSDLPHLELEAGKDLWQGYLLTTGLPENDKKPTSIVPTRENITTNPNHVTISVGPRGNNKA